MVLKESKISLPKGPEQQKQFGDTIKTMTDALQSHEALPSDMVSTLLFKNFSAQLQSKDFLYQLENDK